MTKSNTISDHYARGKLVSSIQSALQSSGIPLEEVTVNDLGPVDEFHTGGRVATAHLLEKTSLQQNDKVLDIGCGIGGTGRFIADQYAVSVRGIDLTPEYIETAKVLNNWVSLSNRIDVVAGDATALPYADEDFDAAIMLHVGMNIAEKPRLFSEIHRVLRPGGHFSLYDVMGKSDATFELPVPWATDSSMSYIQSSAEYIAQLESEGFQIESIEGRGDFAKSFFKKMREANESGAAPAPVGLHLLMGSAIKLKMRNFAQAVFDDILEPTEIIAVKR